MSNNGETVRGRTRHDTSGTQTNSDRSLAARRNLFQPSHARPEKGFFSFYGRLTTFSIQRNACRGSLSRGGVGGVKSCTRSAVVLCSSSQLKLVFMFRIIFDEITIRIRNVQLLKRNNFNYNT